jgi:hypothetical protein
MAAESRPADYRGEGLVEDQPTDNEIVTNWDECIESFDGMDLREDLLRGVYAYGFEKPSAIQQVSVGTSSRRAPACMWPSGRAGSPDHASIPPPHLRFCIIHPSQRAIKPVLLGRDVIAQAQSGEPLGLCAVSCIHPRWSGLMIILNTIFRV